MTTQKRQKLVFAFSIFALLVSIITPVLTVFYYWPVIEIASAAKESPPTPHGYANDFAGLLTKQERETLEQRLSDYAKKTTNEIAVVTIKSLDGQDLEDYTIRLAEKWKVGKKGKDNGVILLIAKEDRKLRIEVGYGLEGVLTDARSKLIIEREITPRFKKGEFGPGIFAGVDAIIGTIGGTYSTPPAPSSTDAVEVPVWLIVLILFGIVGLIVLLIVATGGVGSSGGSWSSGGGGGGGGGGFSGGSFGGGGASGGW